MNSPASALKNNDIRMNYETPMNLSGKGGSKAATAPKKTLDTQHTHKLTEFQELGQKLAALRCILQEKEDAVQAFETHGDKTTNFDEYARLLDERDAVRKDLEALECGDNELDYLINTGSILFQYYDIMEKGADTGLMAPPKLKENSIMKYFVPKKNTEAPNTSGKELSSSKDTASGRDRASLLDMYMAFVDENYSQSVPTELKDCCESCGSSNRNVMLNDGIVYCNDCCCVEYIIVDHDRPSYKDPPREISYFSYKRINHLNEWLSQIQGKETTEIPEEIYDQILLEIKKQQITNMADLKTKKIREILKKMKANKYYEHANHIKHKLNGMPIPHLEPELEEKLRTMFKLIQPPFLKYMPPSRKNFLSYSYVLHKCIQLLGRDEYLAHFPLLKSREKLHEQDQIWKKICQDLGWDFIRSL